MLPSNTISKQPALCHPYFSIFLGIFIVHKHILESCLIVVISHIHIITSRHMLHISLSVVAVHIFWRYPKGTKAFVQQWSLFLCWKLVLWYQNPHFVASHSGAKCSGNMFFFDPMISLPWAQQQCYGNPLGSDPLRREIPVLKQQQKLICMLFNVYVKQTPCHFPACHMSMGLL